MVEEGQNNATLQAAQGNSEASKGEIIEVPFTKVSPPLSIKKQAYERRIQILNNLVKILGLDGARKRIKELATVYKISERQIYKDFDWIKGNFEPADLRTIKIDLKIARDRALEKALELLKDAISQEDKAKAITVLMSVAKGHREESEAWGDKKTEPIRQEINVTGGLLDVNTVINAARVAGVWPEGNGAPLEEQESKGDNKVAIRNKSDSGTGENSQNSSIP
jgi:hypothetical protein